MFSCKACKAKDQHLASMQSEIEHLRKMIFVPETKLTKASIEIDKLMSGDQDISNYTPTDEELKATREILSERDRILSGNY